MTPTSRPESPVDVTCEWIRENSAAHCFGALDQTESDQLERHLLSCAPCDQELSELRRLVPLIGLVPPQVSPADAVWARVLSATRQDDPPRLRLDAAERGPGRATLIGNPARWIKPRWIALPLVAALLLFGGWAANSHRQLDNQNQRVVQLERDNAALATHLSSIKAGEEAYGENTSVYSLLNVDASAGGAGGIMLGDPNQSTALLSVWNMPGNGVSYHVMCESELGELLEAGVLVVDDNGVGSIQLILPSPVTAYRAVHVVTGSGGSPKSGDVPKNDILQVQLIDPTVESITD